jgi:N-acetylglucosamine malate deacetylase 2
MNHLEGKKLMCVVAHPDDESVGFGGALILATERGNETSVICLTDGQAATHRGNATSDAELGKIRREEFQNACKALGVKHCELMGFDDGKLMSVDFSVVAGRLVERIRSLRPDVVVTFGGDGITSHPDHTMTSLLTTAAFHWAAHPQRYPDKGEPHSAQRLYHLTTNFLIPGRQPAMPAPWTVTLNVHSVLSRKLEATYKHTSQIPLFEPAREMLERHCGEEFYTLVATREPQAAQGSTDLFEGLT